MAPTTWCINNEQISSCHPQGTTKFDEKISRIDTIIIHAPLRVGKAFVRNWMTKGVLTGHACKSLKKCLLCCTHSTTHTAIKQLYNV